MSTEICYWGIVEYDNVLILPYCSPYVSLDHYIEMRSPFQLTRNIHLLLHLCLLRYSILKRIKSLLFVMKDSLVVYFSVPHLLNGAVVWLRVWKKIRYHFNRDGFQWWRSAKTRQLISGFPHIQFKLLSARRESNPHGQYGLLKSNKKKSTPDTRVKT